MRSYSSLKASLFAFVFASALSVGCGPSGQDEGTPSSSDEGSLTAQWGGKDNGNGNDKVAICHVPPSHDFVLFVPESALGGHLGHGDCICEDNNKDGDGKDAYWNDNDGKDGDLVGKCGNNPEHGDPCKCEKKNNHNDY